MVGEIFFTNSKMTNLRLNSFSGFRGLSGLHSEKMNEFTSAQKFCNVEVGHKYNNTLYRTKIVRLINIGVAEVIADQF